MSSGQVDGAGPGGAVSDDERQLLEQLRERTKRLVRRQGGRGDVIALSQRLLARNPALAEAWFHLGTAYSGLLPSLALQYLDEAIRLAPRQATYRYNAAVVLLNNRDYAAAIAALTACLEIAPDNVDARVTLARAWLRIHRPAEAAQQLAEAQSRNPRHPALAGLAAEVRAKQAELAQGAILDPSWYQRVYGRDAGFYPTREHLAQPDALEEYFLRGWAPPVPFIGRSDRIAMIGSCFAGHLKAYLQRRG